MALIDESAYVTETVQVLFYDVALFKDVLFCIFFCFGFCCVQYAVFECKLIPVLISSTPAMSF